MTDEDIEIRHKLEKLKISDSDSLISFLKETLHLEHLSQCYNKV